MSTKETTAGHTATPWGVHSQGGYGEDECIGQMGGYALATVHSHKGVSAEENAAFIVRAVNAHDDLVSALELFVGGTNHGNWYGNKKAIEFGRAAIAKAKGGVK